MKDRFVSLSRFSVLRLCGAFVLLMALAGCQTTDTGNKDSIDAALQRAAGNAALYGKRGQSLSYLEKLYMRNSEDPLAALNFARALRHNDQLLRAATLLAPFANSREASANIQAEYAAIQLAQGHYDSAERFARKARVQSQSHPLANHYLGIALDAQGAHEEAENAFRTALASWDGDPLTVMNNLALNLTSQGRFDEAMEILERAQSMAPHRREVERNLRIVRALQQSDGRVIPKPLIKPQS